jgi:tetratricopeptide (TPR) repeat protein
MIRGMKSSLEKDRTYLNWHNSRGIAFVISRGYRWLKDKYLPAVCRLEKAGYNKDRFLLSDCYYMIGDIHDFNECPKAAIKAYQESFDWCPQNASALREIGTMYERMGHYKKASSILMQSFQIDPDDEWVISEYKDTLDAGGVPLYRKEDICWQARECLAKDRPNSALKLLIKKKTVPARQIMACAYGMLDDTNAAIEQWRKIAKVKDFIEIRYADWFYMADAVWNHAAFWEAIEKCSKENRFTYGIWYCCDSLWEKVIPFPAHRKRGSKLDLKRCNKRSFLLAQYHIARINRDSKLACKLFKQYPDWTDVEALCRKLSG